MNAGKDGLYCFFDPKIEKIFIYRLTDAERADMMSEYGSVSASSESGRMTPIQDILFRKQVPYARS